MSARTRSAKATEESKHMNEQSAVAVMMHWMRQIIEQNQYDLGLPNVETTDADHKRPDMVIYESARSRQVLCLIEAKLPDYDVYDSELKEIARRKAVHRKAKYFALTNFKRLVWYDTHEASTDISEEEQLVDFYRLSELENLDSIEQPIYATPIKNWLQIFLERLYELHTKKAFRLRLPIDEYLIDRLYIKSQRLTKYYAHLISDKYETDKEFRKKLKKWMDEQQWSFDKKVKI